MISLGARVAGSFGLVFDERIATRQTAASSSPAPRLRPIERRFGVAETEEIKAGTRRILSHLCSPVLQVITTALQER